jgi:hypothetical protein
MNKNMVHRVKASTTTAGTAADSNNRTNPNQKQTVTRQQLQNQKKD